MRVRRLAYAQSRLPVLAAAGCPTLKPDTHYRPLGGAGTSRFCRSEHSKAGESMHKFLSVAPDILLFFTLAVAFCHLPQVACSVRRPPLQLRKLAAFGYVLDRGSQLLPV